MTNVVAPRIKGWLPGLDRRQVGERYVLNGENFINDVSGPYSAFGYRLMSYETLVATTNQKTFEVEGESLIFCTGAIFAFDTTAQLIYPVFTFADSGLSSPWTAAFVGNKYYFAKRGVGLIQYDPVTYNWQVLSGGSIPSDIWFCDATNGRLFVVNSTDYSWSAFDDGTDFTSSSVTGAGSQSLGIIRNGTPLGLGHINNGMLIYTTEGIVIAQYVDAVNPFYHRELDVDDRPLNAFCIVRKDRDQIILTRTGFYMVDRQGQFSPWQQLMSEYFKDHLVKRYIDPQVVGIFNLFYDPFNKWFYLSVSKTGEAFAYDFAHVLNVNLDEWGFMNHFHNSIIEFSLNSTIFEGSNIGLVDSEGYVLLLNKANYVEATPDYTTLELLELYFDDSNIQSYKNDNVWLMSSIINMQVIGTSDLDDLNSADLYEVNLTDYNGASKHDQSALVVANATINLNTVTMPNGLLGGEFIADGTTGVHTFTEVIELDTIGSFYKLNMRVGHNPDSGSDDSNYSGFTIRISDTDDASDYIEYIMIVNASGAVCSLLTKSNTNDFQENISPVQFATIADLVLPENSSGIIWTPIVFNGRVNAKATSLTIKVSVMRAFSTSYTGTGGKFYFDFNGFEYLENVSIAKYQVSQTALASFIDVGLFRLTDNEDGGQLSTIYHVAVHHDDSNVLDVFEDWLEVTGEEDWLNLSDEEDWGTDNINGSAYSIVGYGTLDGFNVFANQQETLTLNASMDDPTVNSYQTNYYTCQLLGLYQFFRISALEIDETFHLRLLEADAKLTGRL